MAGRKALERDEMRSAANRLIAYHSAITGEMTARRTALESALIPVTAYILTAATEAWYRHPDILRAVEAAAAPRSLGAAGRRPGSRINAVTLWSTANIFLLGRKVLLAGGLIDDDPEPTWTVLDFWERAALGYRGDGHRQAWDAGMVLRPYEGATIEELLAGTRPIADDEARARITRFNALMTSYLFLLYFDTRVGTGDTGPYPVGDGRALVVRDFYLSAPDFWWADVDAPDENLTAALVLEGVEVEVDDWGTSHTVPEDYLPHVVGFGLFRTDPTSGALLVVDPGELDALANQVRASQRSLYRRIAAMSRREKIGCGAYVYFTFPRPLAAVAGVAEDIDWTVPRDTLETLYPILEQIDGDNLPPADAADYYPPIA